MAQPKIPVLWETEAVGMQVQAQPVQLGDLARSSLRWMDKWMGCSGWMDRCRQAGRQTGWDITQCESPEFHPWYYKNKNKIVNMQLPYNPTTTLVGIYHKAVMHTVSG